MTATSSRQNAEPRSRQPRYTTIRDTTWREFTRIPITEELHATAYVNGRARISKEIPDRHVHDGHEYRHVHDGHEYWKDFGREVAVECLETLRCTENLTVGAVWRRGPAEDIARTKLSLDPPIGLDS